MRAGIAILNNVFKVYSDNKALDGTVTVTLPSFELATEAFKGAGLAGEINVPVPGSMSAMTVTISCPVIYGELTKFMELGSTKTIDLRNEIVVQNPDNHAQEKVPNRWVIKAILSKSDPGKVEQAATSEASLEMQVVYMHHWQDGEDILEWDPFKLIYTVNGKDLLEETRQNILA